MRNHYPKLLLAFASAFIVCFRFGYGQQFINRLPIPPIYDQAMDSLTMDIEGHDFNPGGYILTGNNSAPFDTLRGDVNTFAFNHSGSLSNSYLGPTMIWRHGRHQTLYVQNNLPTLSTVHLHGAHVAAWVDGGPHGRIFSNGGKRTVDFDVLDAPCSLWYHPHGLDETYAQVEMGLAGMINVEDVSDPFALILPHTYGVDDIPIIIQDHVFDTMHVHTSPVDSAVAYRIDTLHAGPKTRTQVINGMYQPYVEVPAQPVRFRVLDGSSRLAYQLGIGNSAMVPQTFDLIASDAGYLAAPIPVTTFLTGVGIRNEFVFDFTGQIGETYYLLNMNAQMPNSIIGSSAQNTAPQVSSFMEIRVVAPIGIPGSVPPAFTPLDTFPYNSSTKVRNINLLGLGGIHTAPVNFTINYNQFDEELVNEIVKLDSTEIWKVYNATNIAHPFHIHDIHFFIINVIDSLGDEVSPLPVEFIGPKDDFLIQAGWTVKFATQFTTFGRPGPFVTSTELDSSCYMFHCHILTHEDGYYTPNNANTAAGRAHFGMMQQFVVWNGVGTPTVGLPGEQNLAEGMTLYPNPANEVINIKGESTKPSAVRIFDLQGRLLLEEQLRPFDGTTSIDVSHLETGMVLVEWQSATGRFVRKVILE